MILAMRDTGRVLRPRLLSRSAHVVNGTASKDAMLGRNANAGADADILGTSWERKGQLDQ